MVDYEFYDSIFNRVVKFRFSNLESAIKFVDSRPYLKIRGLCKTPIYKRDE
jgi:hypothetical protein